MNRIQTSKRQVRWLILVSMFAALSTSSAFTQITKATPSSPSSPSLKDTLTWMDNTLNGGHRGMVAQSKRGENHYSFEETTTFTYEQCSMTLSRIAPGDTNESSEGKWKRFDEKFELKDVDPTTIRVVPFSSTYMFDCTDPAGRTLGECDSQAEVQFTTRDEKALIHYDDTAWTSFPNGKAESHTGTQTHSAFGMYDVAYAKRFAKAFRHAVELCGGKPSTF